MKWKKLGHIYAPDGSKPWAMSHAANPVPVHVISDIYRVYFSTRDIRNRSSISWIEIDINRPQEVLCVADEPILGPGELAMFDDSGVSIGCILSIGENQYLYYMGWNLSVTVPWKNSLGLAISEGKDNQFKRISNFPIVDLNDIDPYTISYPWVLKERNKYRMWYGSNIKWGAEIKDMRHLLKYAESEDGINWVRNNIITIDFKSPDEYAICKPCVIKDNDIYRMWFCSRGNRYRICYAESEDGINWERMDDQVGIDVSNSGWDSDMIEYPCVFDHNSNRYMLYSGNAYGKTGFGIAILES